MEKISRNVNKYFSFLVEQYGFIKYSEESDEQDYKVQYDSNDIRIRLEKYRRELYLYLFKPSTPDQEVNLFALIEYLNRETKNNIKSNYFSDQKDINESFRLQIEWLAHVIKIYLPKIREFFSDEVYKQNLTNLSEYLLKQYPKRFKKES